MLRIAYRTTNAQYQLLSSTASPLCAAGRSPRAVLSVLKSSLCSVSALKSVILMCLSVLHPHMQSGLNALTGRDAPKIIEVFKACAVYAVHDIQTTLICTWVAHAPMLISARLCCLYVDMAGGSSMAGGSTERVVVVPGPRERFARHV